LKSEQVGNISVVFCFRSSSNRPLITEWHHSERFAERYHGDGQPKSLLATHGKNISQGEEQAPKQVPQWENYALG